MTSPDGLAMFATSAFFVSAALFARYRYYASERRALADQAEDKRLIGWVQELHTAGVEQATDPNLGAVIQRYAQIHGTGRHRAVGSRPVMKSEA